MLTLTRKVGQKIRIGDEIEIVVREIRGRQVRLGISAPESMPVYREELYLQIANEGGGRGQGRPAEGDEPEQAHDRDHDHDAPKDEG